MNEFIIEYSTVIFAAITMGGIGLLLGMLIAVTAKIFKTASNSRVEHVLELLPGANCGGCGKAGCADFAKAVVSGECSPGQCPVSSRESINTIALLLGLENVISYRKSAVVLCGGDKNQIKNPILYNGINDCRSASLVAGGPKGCAYGCLGLGSCARACQFGAIEIVNGLAVVHSELCVGCGKCVAVCPRKLIKLVNADAQIHIYCSNPEKAPFKRQYCNAACIGCRKCEKAFPDKFTVNGFCGTVNYDAKQLPTAEDAANIKCPANCLLSEDEHLAIEHNDPDNESMKEIQ